MNCNRDESLFSLDLEYIALPLTTQENAVERGLLSTLDCTAAKRHRLSLLSAGL